MKSWLYLALATLALLSTTACSKTSDGDLSDESLEVSLTNVVFSKDGGTEAISVSGVKEWNFLSSVGENAWLQLSKSNNKLTVKATPNTMGRERKAEVLVSSRSGVQKIYVVQSASDLVLSFSESELTFSNKESEKVVQVTTNSESWQFEPLEEGATEWLSIIGGEGAKTIILKVKANKSYEDRSTTLIAKASNGEQVGLKVTQKGVAKYLLPYEPSSRSHSDVDVISFEQSRGSVLQGFQQGSWDNFTKEEKPTVALFITSSDLMPSFAYKRDLYDLKYTVAQTVLYISDDVAQTELHEYDAFLAENGYEKNKEVSKELIWVYRNRDKAIDAQIQIQQGGAIVAFFPYYPQTKDYPTFPSLPVGKDNWLDRLSNLKYKAEDIIRLEQEAGSKTNFVNKDKNNNVLYANAGFDLPKSNDKYAEIGHTYWFYTAVPRNGSADYIQTVSEQAMYFSNPEWGIRVEGRRQIITDELEKLIMGAGYNPDGVSEDGTTYFYWTPVDEIRERVIYVKRVHYTDVNNGNPALMIGFYTIFLPQQGSGAEATKQQSALRAALKGDFEALDYLHTSPRIRAYEAQVANRRVK